MSSSKVVFVFGMGRSGTSALAGVLSLCGGKLPQEILGPSQGNPLGHWEPAEALRLNDAFLAGNDATWHDPTLRLQGEVPFSDEQRTAYIRQIQEFLRSLPTTPFAVVKEPRITVLSDFWFEAARELGLSIGIVVAVRHPGEVTSSLAARDQASAELSQALWLKNNLLAERQSRGLPRVFVHYANLLQDWRAEVARIASALSLDLSLQHAAATDDFLQQDLRRQRHGGRIAEVFGAPWLSQVYEALSSAARDEPLDTAMLDRVFDSFRASERAFRTALDDYRGRFAPREAKRLPNITRLIYAVAGNDSPLLRAALNSPWYIERNPDVFAARYDPYKHWLARGMQEGRLPCDDPLALLDAMMQDRMGRPSAPSPSAPAPSAPAPSAPSPSTPAPPAPAPPTTSPLATAGEQKTTAAVSQPSRIRVICATRKDREAFHSQTALGRSLALQRPPGVELRLFAENTQGLASVYNTAIAESSGEREILLFIHDDVHLCDFHWADRLRDGLRTFDIVGLAGNRRRVPGQPGWGMLNETLNAEERENCSGTVAHGKGFPADSVDVFGPSGQRVALLDGLFIAVNSETLQARSLRFDERFDFHFYDLDFCRQAERAGLAMGTWPISVVHESQGGYVSDGWRRGYDAYLQKWGD